MKTTIVTAFFDIGRGEWTPDKGLPDYLKRSTDTYMERFEHLAQLDNEMIIFTTKDLSERIAGYRQDKPTKIVVIPYGEMFEQEKQIISKIQNDPSYKSQINPLQKNNPEYWSIDYVLINMLKSTFVYQAIINEMTDNPMIAWVDFGYCRSRAAIGNKKEWSPEFNDEKIHMFELLKYKNEPLTDIIFNNIVHIAGSIFLARQDLWVEMYKLVEDSFKYLTDNNLIDDDQTLLLMSYLAKPDLFELHHAGNWDNVMSVIKNN
jgi:protein YibB